MEAAAIYLYDLIDRQGLKIGAVMARAKVGENYLWRLAHGRIKNPSMTKLRSLVNVLKGDINHIEKLLTGEADPHALADEAAHTWLTDKEAAGIRAQARADAGPLSNEELDTLINRLESAKSDRRERGATRRRKRPWLRPKPRL